MTTQDQVFAAVVAWKEDRGGGTTGMQAVINVLQNRSTRDNTSIYSECTARLQFSSLTSLGDPELTLWAKDADPQWAQALVLATEMAAGTLPDITGGSTLYFNPAGIGKTDKVFILPDGTSIPFPQTWNPSIVVYKARIGGHYFFVESL